MKTKYDCIFILFIFSRSLHPRTSSAIWFSWFTKNLKNNICYFSAYVTDFILFYQKNELVSNKLNAVDVAPCKSLTLFENGDVVVTTGTASLGAFVEAIVAQLINCVTTNNITKIIILLLLQVKLKIFINILGFYIKTSYNET